MIMQVIAVVTEFERDLLIEIPPQQKDESR